MGANIDDYPAPVTSDIFAVLGGIHEEVHECLRLLRKHDDLLEQFRPAIEAGRRSPAAGLAAARRARKTTKWRDFPSEI